jgi:hypothetical protein
MLFQAFYDELARCSIKLLGGLYLCYLGRWA